MPALIKDALHVSDKLRGHYALLQQSLQEQAKIDRQLARLLNGENRQSWLAYVLPYVPQCLLPYVPADYAREAIAAYDPLEIMEQRMRQNVDTIALTLRDIAVTAKEEQDRLQKFLNDLKQAKDEKWDAARLQRYMAEESGVKISEEVLDLLQGGYGMLPEEDLTRWRNKFLQDIDTVIANKQEYRKVLGVFFASVFVTVNYGIEQLFDFVENKRPLTVIRDAAHNAAELDQAMFLSKQAVSETFRTAVNVIVQTLGHVWQIEDDSIAAPHDMQAKFKEGTKKITTALKDLAKLQQKHDRPPLLSIDGDMADRLKELEVRHDLG